MDIAVEPVIIEAEITANDVTIAGNSIEACISTDAELEVSVSKREFNIVGDSVYIGSSSEYAPQWLTDSIDTIIASALERTKVDFDRLIAELDVAKNAYFEQVNITALIDERITSHLTTLNATVGTNSGNIVELGSSKASLTDVAVTAATLIDASLNDGAINARMDALNTTIVNNTQALTNSVTALAASFEDSSAAIDTELTTVSDATSAVASSVTTLYSTVDGKIASIISGDVVSLNGGNYQLSSSKLATAPDGSITGWSFQDGTNVHSEFKIKASNFSISDGATGYTPFSIIDNSVNFNGKVSFNSVTDAPPLVAENTNINVSTNLVPNAGWNVGGYGDYQFFGTPTYYRIIGAGTVAEDTLLLNSGDEVYTPYLADMTISYKLSYSFKGAKIGSFITVIGTTPTSVNIIPAGVTVDASKWYNVQIAVLPHGTVGSSLFGFIQEASTLNIVSTINDVVLGATVEKFLMGFVATADTYISRVGIETITSNTLSSVPITAGNVNTVLASTNTTIDGGRITTGYISANRIDAGTITSNKLSTNIALIGGSAYSTGFPYPSGAITGTPAGFRLSSNSAGTSSDPTIYGAYMKGGTIEASTFLYKTTAGLPTKQFITSAYCTYNFVASTSGWYSGVYDGSYTFNLGIYAYNAVTCPTGQRLSQASGNIIEFLSRIEAPVTDQHYATIGTFSLLLGNSVIATFNGHNSGGAFSPTTFNLYGLDISVDILVGVTYDGADTGPTYSGHFYISIKNSSLLTLSGEGELKLKFTHSYQADYLTIQPKFNINNF